MSGAITPKSRYFAFGAIAAIVALVIALSLNQPGGPVVEMVGIVESSAYLPSDIGPATQLASIRLNDGSLIQANVIGAPVRAGQATKVRVYRRIITGTRKYEVINTAAKK